VSEAGTQIGIARARAGIGVERSASATQVDDAAVRLALSEVMDPELPMVSIVDLGMVADVSVGPTIEVGLLPTFVGCPALELIQASVEDRLAAFGRPVDVQASFVIPWTSERITAAGLAALARAGIAPPASLEDTRCPHCASAQVVRDSLFGPTQCRSLFYCRACRQPFEALKLV
jgi:ring-1,2-phenylacetyl-CoA epoxidase subunit PaaD